MKHTLHDAIRTIFDHGFPPWIEALVLFCLWVIWLLR